MSGLETLGGDSVLHVKGYRVYDSRAFQSCADAYYSLNGTTLEAAILLDAEHPGTTPAPLPSMRPLSGVSDAFSAPGGFSLGAPHSRLRTMTALRLPNAWLVVADGKSAAQQLELLHHLQASIRLH